MGHFLSCCYLLHQCCPLMQCPSGARSVPHIVVLLLLLLPNLLVLPLVTLWPPLEAKLLRMLGRHDGVYILNDPMLKCVISLLRSTISRLTQPIGSSPRSPRAMISSPHALQSPHGRYTLASCADIIFIYLFAEQPWPLLGGGKATAATLLTWQVHERSRSPPQSPGLQLSTQPISPCSTKSHRAAFLPLAGGQHMGRDKRNAAGRGHCLREPSLLPSLMGALFKHSIQLLYPRISGSKLGPAALVRKLLLPRLV